ncbi:gpW family head-tail joining protein [Rickettsia endosymbiont of Cardiosporidium cionae]|uniref:gpW family head-tail joining protein n=1 Tax=Rickettsia endosymbiont of Cardiosporidium cionae TaxID=2777155 RepID=UPI00189578FD|nr:gpW family head-tail joining protein [Rickettsia endosymbiont of Cardiosporidium cionae]KAF8818070.1 hypothetical protein IHI24_000869 [Rickettsia endosymbiont of Cardiosporidium cionae]
MTKTIQELELELSEAEDALKKLLLGQKEVSVNVGSYGSVNYRQASTMELRRYILQLKNSIAIAKGLIPRRVMYCE